MEFDDDAASMDADLPGPPRLPAPDAARVSISMPARDAFYGRVAERTRSLLSPELRSFTARPMFNIMKFAYDNERVHYEIVLDVTRRWIEIALHFEDGPASTLQYLRLFDSRIVELKDDLGPEIELERWTQSWGRIYELWPLTGVDRALADSVAERLAAYITTLQPILDQSGIKPERAATKSGRR